MRLSHCCDSRGTRTLFAAAWGAICLLIVGAPVLAQHSCRPASTIVYLLFSFVCHQNPERCFTLSGYPLAVCHRCAGMYAGFLLGSLFGLGALHRSLHLRRTAVLTAIGLMFIDVLASSTGLWNSSVARVATGLLFGIVIASLIVRGFSEFLRDVKWRRLTAETPQLKGGLS